MNEVEHTTGEAVEQTCDQEVCKHRDEASIRSIDVTPLPPLCVVENKYSEPSTDAQWSSSRLLDLATAQAVWPQVLHGKEIWFPRLRKIPKTTSQRHMGLSWHPFCGYKGK